MTCSPISCAATRPAHLRIAEVRHDRRQTRPSPLADHVVPVRSRMSCRTQYRTPPGPPAPSIAHVANADRQQQAACAIRRTILARFQRLVDRFQQAEAIDAHAQIVEGLRHRWQEPTGWFRGTVVACSLGHGVVLLDGISTQSLAAPGGRRLLQLFNRAPGHPPKQGSTRDRPNPRHCQSFELVNLTGRRSFGFHQGQRSAYRSAKAGYMTASSTAVLSQFLPCNTGGVHT